MQIYAKNYYESDKYDETNTGASFTRGEKIKNAKLVIRTE